MKNLKNITHKKDSSERQFIIHTTDRFPLFPTHTHGLTEIGFPEFLMDPLSFGPKGTGNRINSAYDYFSKPDNKDKLEAIKNGNTVKLTFRELTQNKYGNENYTY
ncbi:MAG: hypothetical protein ABSC11_13130, partial [Smithella sp.]